jgi:hypothetical protein
LLVTGPFFSFVTSRIYKKGSFSPVVTGNRLVLRKKDGEIRTSPKTARRNWGQEDDKIVTVH